MRGAGARTVSVVSMAREHLELLARLERLCFSEPWSVHGLETELANPDAAFLVALLDGETAGYLGMHCVLDVCSLTNVAVFPAYRRRGVGQALLTAAVGEAEARGAAALTLEVRASNAAAIRLYTKNGFRRVGERPGFYRNPSESALLLTRVCGGAPEPIGTIGTEGETHEAAGD